MYTSGTTSHPKGVMISYGNLYWKCFDHILEFNLSPEDRCLVVMPLFHSGGMDLPATSVIYRGGTIVLNRKFDPLETIQSVVRERITHLLLTPSAVNRVLAERSFRSEDLRTLKVLVDGGEKMPMPLAEKIITTMPELWFCNGFGMTETVTGDTFVPKEMIIEKIGSVGRAVAAVQVSIVDNDDRELPAGVAGEVVLRGPKVFKGYWRNPAATAEAFRNGWFHTGDIGYLDEDSYLYIVDRK
jgi:acyl-CoA synthetase (AMP-forming)/AMP-acid ligase II